MSSSPRSDARQRVQSALDVGIQQHWPFDEDARADLVLEAGSAGTWTVRARGNQVTVVEGSSLHPTAVVYTDAETLAEILEGKRSGLEVWLKGYLRVRGSIALAMTLEGLIQSPRPSHFPRPKRLRVGDIDTFYLEAGEGSPMVLFHGLGATCASMLTTLQEFSRERRVIAVDLPGFGESSKPIRKYDAAFFAKWAKSFLDALGLERPVLIGNSMGGRVALEVALRHPERVDRVCLYAPAMAFRKFRNFVPLVRVLRPELGMVPHYVPRATVMATLKMIFSQPDRVPPSWYDAAVDEYFRVFAQPRARHAFYSAAQQIYLDTPWGQQGFWSRLRWLTRPALFVWGDRDVLVPAKFGKHVRYAVPKATSVVLEDCGHVPQFEMPDVLHEHVREFLGKEMG